MRDAPAKLDAVAAPPSLDEPADLRQTRLAVLMLRSQEVWITVAVLVLGVVVGIIAPNFATAANLGNVLQNFCFVGILAIGATPIIITGGIDISIGSLMGLCGVVMGLLLNAEWSLPAAIAATLALGAVLGAINGLFVSALRLPPFLVTLGTLSIYRSLALIVSNNQVVYTLGHDEAATLALGGGKSFGLPNVFYGLVAMAALLHALLTLTRWGRYVHAIGGNERAARLNGIAVKAIKVSVYAFGGLMGGVCAIFLVGWLGSVTNSLGQGDELRVIAGAVIGGATLAGGYGSAFGAAIGSLLIEEIRNALLLAGVTPYWQGAFVGGFILLAITLQRLRQPEVE